ncbi:MAG: LysM peptidoglycan-binding domain-containing protein [Desulfovibrio sp.]|uniref:LysM peptidoglycan-binding domain-containing protein n=1 Tax=Desulfovibrio sp. 7SRBS1 TaxID=3378064 RepID=UPI003B3C6248
MKKKKDEFKRPKRRNISCTPLVILAVLSLLLTACVPKKNVASTEATPVYTVKEVVACPTPETDPEAEQNDSDVESLDPELQVEAPAHEVAPDEEDLSEQQKKALDEDAVKFALDVRETKEFLYYYKFYTDYKKDGSPGKGRKAFTRWLERAKPFLPYVRKVINQKGLPEDIIFLPFAESGYNPWAYSWAGAGGMWQFMRGTGKLYGLRVDWWVDERRDPYRATEAAVAYLDKLHGDFDDWYLALAAYNAGEGKVGRAIKKCGSNDYFEISKHKQLLKKETRHYVPKILAILHIVRNLEKLGFEPIDWNYDAGIVSTEIKGGTDLTAMASACGLSWQQFHKYNPMFRRTASPPDTTMKVYLPQDKLAKAESFLKTKGARPFAGYSNYLVRNGDSWWRISRRSGVPISVLKRVNNTRSNTLRPGQRVMIPGKGSHINVDTPVAQTRQYAARRANYIVLRGDSLWTISRKFGVSLDTLKRANGMRSGRNIKPGQKLYIPDAGVAATKVAVKQAESAHRIITHRVRRGDTIWAIARRYNVPAKQILSTNNLSSTSVIRPGDKLKIVVE